ncbi:MAG: bifunctional metallophosphatase/5'-nucleotidase [Acidobacteria bacterium]|nr:bifunctional metallophosphatase/5'-nucleotidase [Acidobacteriota bacterium]
MKWNTKVIVVALGLSLLSLLSTAAVSREGARVTITILGTTDLHGHIYPFDYYADRPANRGLAKAYTIIKEIRRTQPNTLLIDSGDTIQGTPLIYYHNRIKPEPPDPMMLAMSYMRYDAMCVGNHEFNFGLQIIDKARRECNFPWLSANTYRISNGSGYFTPYLIREVGGVRVGILGLTTPGIPTWENITNYPDLTFRDGVSEARKWVAILRGEMRCDVVVVASHMGLDRDPRTGRLFNQALEGENAAFQIATSVPGVDLVFMGHTHRRVDEELVNGVLLTQANKWAEHVARADIELVQDIDGRWKIHAKHSRAIAVDDQIMADAEILQLAEPYHLETQQWLSKRIGQIDRELDGRAARTSDHALLDLVHRAQLEYGHADVSLAAMLNPELRMPAGPVTVRQIAALYIYENTLVTLELTGDQLHRALEHAAGYFNDYRVGMSSRELTNPEFIGYNYDTAEGVEYEIDLRRPRGSRIVNLRYRGRPLKPDEKLRVVTNNYRVNGGGGYTMLKGAKVLYRSSDEIRNLIIEWVEKYNGFPSEPSRNWRLLPAGLPVG